MFWFGGFVCVLWLLLICFVEFVVRFVVFNLVFCNC